MQLVENEKLKKAIISVAEKQIKDNEPPETGQTLKRLQQAGYSRDDSLKLIGYIVGHEFFGVVAQGAKYDEVRYVKLLQGLPRLPWDS